MLLPSMMDATRRWSKMTWLRMRTRRLGDGKGGFEGANVDDGDEEEEGEEEEKVAVDE